MTVAEVPVGVVTPEKLSVSCKLTSSPETCQERVTACPGVVKVGGEAMKLMMFGGALGSAGGVGADGAGVEHAVIKNAKRR